MLASLILAVLSTSSSSLPQQLAEALHRIAAHDARDCGIVALDQDGTAAVTCAKEALNSGKPFVIAVQSQGIDSQLWSGAVRAKDGLIWLIRYDSDATGGYRDRATPTLDSFVCKDLAVSFRKRAAIMCPSQPWR